MYDPDLALDADAAVGVGIDPVATLEKEVLNMIVNLV